MCTKVMELNYGTSTVCESARYNEQKQEWEVKVLCEDKPKVPSVPGQDELRGEQ